MYQDVAENQPLEKDIEKSKARWNLTGRIMTGLAMVPQGIMAALLTDNVIRKPFQHKTTEHQGAVDDAFIMLGFQLLNIAIGITAFEGKRRLITYFNSSGFEELATINRKMIAETISKRIAETNSKAFKETFLTLLNHIFSIIPSLGFAFLSQLSLLDAADFLREYNIKALDIGADIVAHPATILIFSSSSFIVNMLSFPGLHTRGLTYFKDMLTTLSPCQKSQKEEQTPLLKDSESGHSTRENAQVSNWRARGSAFLGLTMSGIVISGLLNFLDIGSNMAGNYFHLEEHNYFKKFFGVMMMASMCCMAMHPGKDIEIWANNLGSSKNKNHFYKIPAVIAVLVCALGGAPNAYQARYIAKQGLFLVTMAALASFILEVGGFYKLTIANAEADASKKLETHFPENISSDEISESRQNQETFNSQTAFGRAILTSSPKVEAAMRQDPPEYA